MTQSHKSKLTLQVLAKKCHGKYKRKTIVLKKRVGTQRIADLHIYHYLQPKAIRKIGSNANIQFSPCSHAVIRENSNCLGLVKLKANGEEDDSYIFSAFCEEDAPKLHELGDTIQELCGVESFSIDINSASSDIPTCPAYLHITKNKVSLTSKPPSITVFKEWQFRSLQIFNFEKRGIHIYDTEDHCSGEVYVCCRSDMDALRIKQKISLECNPCYNNTCNGKSEPLQYPVHQRPPDLSPPTWISSSFSDNSCSSSPISSPDPESPTTPSIPDSPVFQDQNTNNFHYPESNPQHVLQFSERSKSSSVTSVEYIPKFPLKSTSSSPESIRSRRLQSPKHSEKEHVVIRFPANKRSKSASDLSFMKQVDKEAQEILRASSLDSYSRQGVSKKKYRTDSHCTQKDITKQCAVKTLPTSVSEKNSNQEINKEIQIYSAPKQKPPTGENVFKIEKEMTTTDSPQYANIEPRPNCYIYQNVSHPEDAPEIPNSYVNVFSGSSIKGCYENCNSGVFDLEIHYSSIEECADVPPPKPKPRRPPPRLPPKNSKPNHHENYPGKTSRIMVPTHPPAIPPKRPPKLKSPNTNGPKNPSAMNSTDENDIMPSIQVTLFSSHPTCGLVWFLRIAFMHQDDTTFKRVTGIEEASNHKLQKSAVLQVPTDINVTVNLKAEGFMLMNESQQEVQVSDINKLRKGDWFVIEFHIKQTDLAQVQFNGDVSIEPKAAISCSRAYKASMGISESFPTKTSTTNKPARKALRLEFNKYEKLCKTLDQTTNSLSHNWRHVADALGFTLEEIMDLNDKYYRTANFSPTDNILQVWEQRDPSTCSLEQLVSILREIGRLDIVEDLGYSTETEGKWNDGFKKV